MFAACAFAGSVSCVPAWAQSPAERSSAEAGPTPAFAQQSGVVSLAAAVDSAWRRAVAARESLGRRQHAEALRQAAASPWAAPPALELGHRDDRWHDNEGSRETEIGVALPLLLPGQGAARIAAADAGIAVAEQAQDLARLRVAGEVREAAWAIAAGQAELAQAEAHARSLTLLADDVDRRLRAGDLARADALVARAEALEAATRASDARQRLYEARLRWNLLTRLDDAPVLDDRPTTPTGLDRLSEHPEMRLATRSTVQARRKLDLLRVSRRDAPELTVGLRQDVSGRGEPSRNSIAVGLRLPFGTDDRNRPLEAAALTEVNVAETREQRLRERLHGEVLGARAAVEATEQELAATRERAAMLRERASLIDRSFRAGESPLPELLRALSSAAQAEAALARQQAALGLARARLEQSLGILP